MSRILMVDDEVDVEPLVRGHFRREIRKGIYDFEFAHTGDAALNVLGEREPSEFDAVLSDINMPGMTGVELLEVNPRPLARITGLHDHRLWRSGRPNNRVRDSGGGRVLRQAGRFRRAEERTWPNAWKAAGSDARICAFSSSMTNRTSKR